MISGVVTASRDATVPVMVRGPEGQEREIEAIIDTGFNGWFSLPAALIAELDLPWRGRGRAALADGSECVFDIHEGTVVWDGAPRRVAVDAADADPTVGMSLLYGYELIIRAMDGGTITITALP